MRTSHYKERQEKHLQALHQPPIPFQGWGRDELLLNKSHQVHPKKLNYAFAVVEPLNLILNHFPIKTIIQNLA